jgi:DNA-directed RNA polymerase specialized sigma24 family protein
MMYSDSTVTNPEPSLVNADRIDKAMARLSPWQRRLVLLIADGHTHAETARLLDTYPRRVKTELAKIRALTTDLR